MSEKFDQLKIMQEMFPNATFVDANGERVADTSKTIDHIVDVSKKVSLTEQWRKGKLEAGWYYVLLLSNEEYITFIDGNWVVDDRLVGADIKQVLAPVPSYEEWQSLNELLDSSLQTNKALAHRLNVCKELLKECQHYIVNTPVYPQGDDDKQDEIHILVDKIDEALK